MFAEIIIPLALPKNYTWLVPEKFQHLVKPGSRVEVGLGKNKKYAGIVKRFHYDRPETFEPKDILNVLDTEPVIFEQQLKLWQKDIPSEIDHYRTALISIINKSIPHYIQLV